MFDYTVSSVHLICPCIFKNSFYFILLRYKNLTNKYYAKKLHRHILHLHLAEKWKALLEEPRDAQKLEKGKD